MREIIESFLAADIGLPLITSLVTGMLIGVEREMQSKPAGLRTHALVCFASTLLTLAAVRQGEWTVAFLADTQIAIDPTRMAHGILTGIGFLGAGVIFREGPSVHGLTTAASLWMTAALGIIYGIGMYWLALSGTIATLLVLVALRLFYSYLPRHAALRLRIAVVSDAGFGAKEVEQLLSDHGFRMEPLSQRFDRAGGITEFGTTTYSRRTAKMADLTMALEKAPAVQSFLILPIEDAGVFQSMQFSRQHESR